MNYFDNLLDGHFHINLLQNYIHFCLKKTENKRKRSPDGPFLKK